MSLARRFAPLAALAAASLAPLPAFAQAAAAPAPAAAMAPVSLSPAEVEALKRKLIEAKPNLNTVTLFSFLAPGSGQAYMGHIDRSFLMWGGYLVGFTALKLVVPDSVTASPGGPKVSDLAVTGLFIGVATVSALDAFFLALKERAEYDVLINRLSEKQQPSPVPHL